MQTTVASSNTVALDFGRALFGPIGGLIFSAMVAISCLGALQGADNARSIAPILSFFRFDIVFVGGLFTSARLVYASGQEGFLPSFFGQLHSRLKTPLNATALHATLTILFIAVGGGFRSLINFCESEGLIVIVGWLSCIISSDSVAGWGFYFLTVSNILVYPTRCSNAGGRSVAFSSYE